MKLRAPLTALAVAALSLGCPGGEGGVGGVLVVSNVEVTPNIADVVLGQTRPLTATPKTASGIIVTGRAVSWSTTNSSVATVSSGGVVTGMAVGGPVLIRATVDGVTGDAAITVRAVPVDHITVEPPTANVLVQGQVPLTARAFAADNAELPGRQFNWQSSDHSIATVTTNGIAIGVKEGGPVTITASAEGKSGTASVSVSNRPATRLGFAQQPGRSIAGQAIIPPVQVELLDALLIRVIGAPNPVTIQLAGNPGGATLSGQTTVTPQNGVATFNSLSLNKVGTAYTFLVTSPGLVEATSIPFDVIAGSANQLAFLTTPATTAQSGIVLGQQPVVQLRDNSGNVVAQANVVITAGIGSGAAGATLGGTLTATTNASGIASFGNLAISGLAGSYTLSFASPGVTTLNSAPIVLSPGPAAALFLATPPSSSAQSNAPLPQQPAIQLKDAAGNNVALAGVTVVAAIATGSGSVGGNTSAVTSAAGLATFSGLSISGPSGTYTLRFSAGALIPVTSGPITLGAGGATQLAIAVQPSSSAASGAILAQQPAAQLKDASNNNVAQAGVAVTASVSAGGTLLGTVTQSTNASGLATFTNLAITALVGNYTLSFTSPGLSASPASSPIAITAGPATRLGITRQPPSAAVSGVAFAAGAQPIIQVLDAAGNPVSQAGTTVTAALASGPAGGTLGGTLTAVTGSGGAATFTNLAISGPSGSYTLRFTTLLLAATPASGSVTLGAGAPTTLAVNSVTSQSATVGTAVAAPPSVKVTDGSGNPVAGVAVTFAVTAGGGTVVPASPTTVMTNVSGIATATSWTLGPTSGTNNNIVTATAAGLSGSPVTFTASGTTGGATTIAANSVTTQSATVATAVTAPPSVKVTDAGNNPVAGVQVTFAVTAGGGTVVPAGPTTVSTNASGVATATSWTLGPTAGTNNNTVTATATGLSGSPVTFTASGTAGAANTIAANSVTTQNATVGTAVAAPPSVKVTDANGNPKSGVAITFTLTSGGGTLSPVSPAVISTNTSGIATLTSWTLGPSAGANTVTAAASVPNGSPVTFTATGTAAAAQAMIANSATTQSATVGTAVSAPPSVKVTDVNGNGVAGIAVTFSLTAGGGTLLPSSPAIVNTNSSGIASLTSWTLGTTSGTNTVTASASVSTGSPVTFTATGTAGAASTIAANSQTTQSATVGAVVGAPPSVLVTDAHGNPVSGTPVTFTVTAGGGTLSPPSPAVINTNSSGIAALTSWTLGASAGTNTVTAAASVPNGSPVTFNATGTAAAAHAMAANSTTTQSATVGTAVAAPPSVKVTDINGNPVAGITVAFAVTSGGGSSSPATPAAVNTDVSGVASLSSWTLGTTAGANTVTASASVSTGSPVTFSATGTAGTPSQLTYTVQPSPTATSGQTFGTPPALLLQDAFGNPVASTLVTATITGSPAGVTFVGTPTATTNASGVATFSGLGLSGLVGSYTLTFTAGAVTSVASNAITLSAGAANTIAANSTTTQSATVGTAVSAPPSVIVTDASGNPVSGAAVTFTLTAGGGTLSPVSPAVINTDVAGIATVTSWTLGTTAGTNTVTASAAVPTGSPVTFSATGTAGTPSQLTYTVQPSPTATSGQSFGTPPALLLQDAFGNPVASTLVTATITGSPAGVTFVGTPTATTNASGVATFSGLGLSGLVGSYTLTFTAGAVTSVASNAITLSAGAANTIAANSTTTQSATVGTAVSAPPSVIVTDASGNPVSGAAVTFTLTAGGGTLSPVSPAVINTDVAGIATVTSWTLGTTAGTNTVTASAAVPTGSPVVFNATGTAGAANTITANSAISQSATVGTAVTAPPSVLVTDASGNPVSGTPVTFTLTAGGGTLNPASPAVINTDVAGIATLTSWTLGTTTGTNTVTASATLPNGSPVTFTATGTAGSPSQLTYSTQPSPTATNGQAFGTPPVLLLKDAFSNPVGSTLVTATITGSPAGVAFVGTPTATTDAAGLATFSGLGLSGPVATYTLTFTAGAANSGPSDDIVLSAGPASTIVANSVTTQTATTSTAVADPPSVKVTDAGGNPVSGISVTFAVTAGSGTVVPTSPLTTDGAGIASATSWTVGSLFGTNNNTVTATSTGLTGSPVSFRASGTTATQIAITTQPSALATSGVDFTQQPSVRIRNAGGNVTEAGIVITVSLASGTGTLSGNLTATTSGGGVATFSGLRITGSGDHTLRFSSGNLTPAVSNTISLP